MLSMDSLLERLIGVQSDTGTALEVVMAAEIESILRQKPYFLEHPELAGSWMSGDPLGRPVVWALRRGRTGRTLVLEAHYDAVEIESYGPLKPWALQPAALKAKMLESGSADEELAADLASGEWLVGRGSADMKAGLAINLEMLDHAIPEDLSLLFLAVPDEENISSGAIQAVGLLHELAVRFDLEYRLCIITEPQIAQNRVRGKPAVQIIRGSTGKILPVVLVKGVLAHSAEILKGLNSSFLLARIVSRFELSMDTVVGEDGVSNQPPATLLMRDLKSTYDVSLPEYSGALFNVLYTDRQNPDELVEALRRACAEGLASGIARYDATFDAMSAKGFGVPSTRNRYAGEVLTLQELDARVRSRNENFEAFKADLEASLRRTMSGGSMGIHAACLEYLRAMTAEAGIPGPVAVIGLAPPFYPAVSTDAIGADLGEYLAGVEAFVEARFGVTLEQVGALSGMCDLSYLSSPDPEGSRRLLDNMPIPREIYDVPVERIAQLNIPSIIIGPRGKAVHQAGERVYLPDVRHLIPALMGRIMENL